MTENPATGDAATRDLEELLAQGAIVQEGLGGPETRYWLNTPLREPIEPLNEPLNDRLVKLIATHPGYWALSQIV